MKTFSLSTSQSKPPHLWQAAAKIYWPSASGQISEGLDGNVAQLIIDWAQITQKDFCKISRAGQERQVAVRNP